MGAAIDRSYAGADLGIVKLGVGGFSVLSGVLAALFLPLEPPTDPLGSAGWAVAGAIIVAMVFGGVRLIRFEGGPSVDLLLVISYLGLGAVVVLVWLGGGAGVAYQKLGLLWVGSAMAVHPAARSLPYLAVTYVLFSLPLVYNGWSEEAAVSIGSDLLLWTVIGLAILILIARVRRQRIDLKAEEEAAQELARADSLTRLSNRRAFDEAVEAELSRSARAGSTTSVVILDVDAFKALNDRFGHLEGDRCLRDVATAVAETTRAGDRGFRWGGDEFVLLMPDTDLTAAREAGERVARRVEDACFDAEGRPLSISWGAAEAKPGIGVEELLTHADLALLQSKRSHYGGLEKPETPAP